MSKSFDEWFDNQDIDNWTNKKYMLQAYEAGANSRQLEIDGLKAKYTDEIDTKQLLIEEQVIDLGFANAEVEELQKRIEEALKFADDAHSEFNIGMLAMVKILKGEQNEN